MLELFGSEYVADHVLLEYNNRQNNLIYKMYVTDIIKTMAQGHIIKDAPRYIELIRNNKQEEKSGDEIALDVIRRLELAGVNSGCNESSGETVT